MDNRKDLISEKGRYIGVHDQSVKETYIGTIKDDVWTDLKPLTAIGQFGVCRWHNAKGKIRNLKYTWLIVIRSVMYGIMDVVSK